MVEMMVGLKVVQRAHHLDLWGPYCWKVECWDRLWVENWVVRLAVLRVYQPKLKRKMSSTNSTRKMPQIFSSLPLRELQLVNGMGYKSGTEFKNFALEIQFCGRVLASESSNADDQMSRSQTHTQLRTYMYIM